MADATPNGDGGPKDDQTSGAVSHDTTAHTDDDRMHAAVTIQDWVRRTLGLKPYESESLAHAHQEDAALVLQRWARRRWRFKAFEHPDTDHVIIYPPTGPLGLTFKWEEGTAPAAGTAAVPVAEAKAEVEQGEKKGGEAAGGGGGAINRRGFIVQSKPDLEDMPEANTVAAALVEVGDILISIDGHDLTYSMQTATDLLRAKHTKSRELTFTRPPRPPSAAQKAVGFLGGKPHHAHHRRKTVKRRKSSAVDAGALLNRIHRKQKGEDKRVAEERRHAEELRRISELPVMAPLQFEIQDALHEDGVLSPLHVELHNDSYWYLNRKRLGGQKHMQVETIAEVSEDKMEHHHDVFWHANIYRWEVVEEDALGNKDNDLYGPMQVPIEGPRKGAHKGYRSEIKAMLAAEAACKLRDASPGETPGPKTIKAEEVLATHFRVLIVSKAFVGRSYIERSALVFEALAKSFGGSNPPTNDDLRQKKFSYLGTEVRNLPIWRHLGELSSNLLLDMRTPAQWRPDYYEPGEDERYGQGRNASSSLAPWHEQRFNDRMIVDNVKFHLHDEPWSKDGGDPHHGQVEGAHLEHREDHVHPHHYHDGQNPDGASPDHHDPHGHDSHGQGAHGQGAGVGHHDSHVSSSQGHSSVFDPHDPHHSQDDHHDTGHHGSKDRSGHLAKHHRRKVGGVYAHHFYGLPEDDRTYLNHQISQEENVQIKMGVPKVEALPYLGKEKAHHTEEERIFNHAVAESAEEKKHVMMARNREVVARFETLTHRIGLAAVRLQRAWRMRILPKGVRLANRRQRATIHIQRVLRGHFGRVFAVLYRRVVNMAASKIESHYKALIEYRMVRAYRALMVAAAIRCQAAIRGYLAKSYLEWMIINGIAATKIQRIWRAFLARRVFHLLRITFLAQTHITPAVLWMQQMSRRFIARSAYIKTLAEHVHTSVVIPASMLLQRTWWGHLAKKIANKKRMFRDNATEIQRHVRGFVKRRWIARVKQYMKECFAVTEISRVFRGFVEREIHRRRREKHYHFTRTVPCSIIVQARYRGYVARRNIAQRKIEWLAGLKIQLQFRLLMAKREASNRWLMLLETARQNAALVIQMAFRCHSARVAFEVMRIAIVGKRIYAARVVLRAWLRSRDGAKFRQLKEAWEVEKSAEVLMELNEERSEVLEDLEDIRFDILDQRHSMSLAEKRIVHIKRFKLEAELRIPKVERELEDLNAEEVQQGWGSAYDDELERLTNMLALSAEELRLQKVKVRKCKDKIQALQLEMEDVEADLDENAVRECAEFELLRRMELQRADKKAEEHWRGRVRREICKWAVPDVRRNVIRRTRYDLEEYKEAAQKYKPNHILTTVSYQKRADWSKDEKHIVNKMERKQRKIIYKHHRQEGQDNTKIRSAYDSVISGCMEILHQSTFEMRHEKTDVREDPETSRRLFGRAPLDPPIEDEGGEEGDELGGTSS